jgi:hypothetical protein
MAEDAMKAAMEQAKIEMKRAGLKPDQALQETLAKALIEVEQAGKRVRKDIKRNDEPASGFHVPWESK